MRYSDRIQNAVEALEACLRKGCPGFEDVGERLHRITECRLNGRVLTFTLERHPDDWTSVQRFRFNTENDELTFLGEEVIELLITGESLVTKELNKCFEAAGMSDFHGCSTEAEIRQRAQELAHEFLQSLSEEWSDRPEEVENSADEIRQEWDKARLDACEIYPDAFVRRAVQEFQRWHRE